MSEAIVVLYVPVLHRGYLDFFYKYQKEAEEIYLLGPDLIKDFFPFHEEIRAIDPEVTKKFIESLGIFRSVGVLTKEMIPSLFGKKIITASEEVSRQFIERYCKNEEVEYATIFLRWDETNVQSSHKPDYAEISETEFDRTMMAQARKNAEKSADWWRHVGGVVVRGKEVILEGNNIHLPQEQIHYIEGDPRDVVKAGTSPEVATAIHSEQIIIAEAARLGISLDGTSMYLNVFPCHTCAKLMSRAGIKKCFFAEGNAYMDSEKVLQVAGVEIIWVK